MTDANKRYSVRRLGWYTEEKYPGTYCRRAPTSELVATFAEHEDAIRDYSQREADARSKVNPFRCGGDSLFFQTTFPPPIFCDWLLDHGIDPPEGAPNIPYGDWKIWWELVIPTLSESQKAAMWEALNKVRFFEVVEESIRGKVYIVIQINWSWNDDPWLDADPEGGTPITAFRTRAAAEAECAERNRRYRVEGDHGRYDQRCYEGRVGEFRRMPAIEADFFEVVEIDAEGLS